jgi:hypothetical protein
MFNHHRFVSAAAGLLTAWSLLAPGPAVAQPAKEEGRAEAKRLLRAGTTAYTRHDYSTALADFQKAFAAFPSARIQYNLGQAFRELGRPVEATMAFESFLADADRITSQQRKEAASAIKELESQVARVTLITNVAEVDVFVDGVSRGTTPLPAAVVLAPGAHEINLTRTGYTPVRESLTVSAGEQRRASFVLERSGAASAAAPKPAPPVLPASGDATGTSAPTPVASSSPSLPPPSSPSSSSPSTSGSPPQLALAPVVTAGRSDAVSSEAGPHKVLGATLLAASAGFAVGGAVLLGASWLRYNEAKDSGCGRNCGDAADQVEARALWSKILFGAAAVSGAGAAAVFLAFPDPPTSHQAAARPGGILVVSTGRF